MRRGLPGLALVLALACGARDPAPAPDPSAAAPPVAPRVDLDRACDLSFDVLASTRCGGIAPPAATLAAMRVRYERSCAARLALPGSSWTGARFEACASAVESLPCDATEPPPSCIVLPGALAPGAPCEDDAQCASTHCERAFGSTGGQPALVPTCGTCAEASAAGEACAGGPSGGCLDGAACTLDHGARVCEAVSYGAAGDACDDAARACARGTACDASSSTCVALGNAGDACTDDGDCTLPLACSAGRCADPGPEGAPCAGSRDCAAGLVCANDECVAPSWSAPGEPCGPAAPCLTGDCPEGGGACPRVLADGAACVAFVAGTTCDAFAACTDGICTLEYAATCP